MFFLLILHLFYVTSVTSHHDRVNDPLKVNSSKGIISGDENCIAESGESTESLKYEIPCGISNVSDLISHRIVGGETAKPYEFPWLVSIQSFDKVKGKYNHNCGGSIIHPLFILTAAHGISEISTDLLLILAGKFNLYTQEDQEQSRGVVDIFYKDFDIKTAKNDIALLKLNASLIFEPYFVGPVCLPEGNILFKEKGVLAGWGSLKENGNLTEDLQKVTLDIIDKNICRNVYINTPYSIQLHENQICTLTDNKDACDRDSGSPLMSVNKKDDNIMYINGIVSWGSGCARKNFPGIYTQVACYIKWIKNNIARETQK